MVKEGAIVELWVPVVVAGHAFALFWLLKALLVFQPRLPSRVAAALGLSRRRQAAANADEVGPVASREPPVRPPAAYPAVAPVTLAWNDISCIVTSPAGGGGGGGSDQQAARQEGPAAGDKGGRAILSAVCGQVRLGLS